MPPPQGQLFAIQLARERFRQQAMGGLLAQMGIDAAALSNHSGGDLCLLFTQTACNRLQEQSADGLSNSEILAGVRADLCKACDLFLERDRKSEGPVLKIHSKHWFLIAKPGKSVWVVVTISPQKINIRGALAGLSWRLLSPDENSGAPLPLWLMALAQVHDRELRIEEPRPRRADRPSEERVEAARLHEMRDALPNAMEDLCAAFRLLQWERQQRERRTWKLKLSPLAGTEKPTGQRSYLIEGGKAAMWPERGLRLSLGPEPHARWVEAAPDPDSPSHWVMHSKTEIPNEVTVFELQEDGYRRQAAIAERLTKPWLLKPEDAALAATQILMPTTCLGASDFDPLPGEYAWEPRQRQALRLALADHPICAVKGPPGTGKSTVIVGLVRRAIHAGKRVLLVAPTHVALDEVLGRIHELREKDQERAIVAARVAPADERRAQIKPELEVYIARHLGRNLARNSIKNIRLQIAALPSTDKLVSDAHILGETTLRLRELAAGRGRATRAKEQFDQAKLVFAVAEEAASKRHTDSHATHASMEAAFYRDTVLREATRRFSEIESRFFGTRHTVASNERFRDKLQGAFDRSRATAEEKHEQLLHAEATLAFARKLEEKGRPSGKWGRFVERILSSHARAMEAVVHAEKELTTARDKRDSSRKAFLKMEANLGCANLAVKQALDSVEDVRREVREFLLPAKAFIKECYVATSGDCIDAMPEPLKEAVSRTTAILQSAAQAVTHAEQELAKAEDTKRSTTAALDAAGTEQEQATEALSAVEAELQMQGIEIGDVSSARIAELEDRRNATFQEVERITRRRALLQRWLEVYEREDSEEQITAWALTSVNLVAATTQGIAGSQQFRDHQFDLVICDESSRVTRGEILVPADRAGRLVLVGDEKQLPPYVDSEDEQFIQALAVIHLAEGLVEGLPDVARRLCDDWNVDEPEFRPVRVKEVCERAAVILAAGDLPEWPPFVTESESFEERLRAWRRVADALTVSCFDHLLSFLPETGFVRLSVQRRMVPEIAKLVSKPVYDGDYQSPEKSPVTPLLTDQFAHAWTFFDTTSYCAQREEFREECRGKGFCNKGEAKAVVLALKDHIATAKRTGKPIDGLMVITFYLAQAHYIEELVRQDKHLRGRRITILPIDRCQGQEADVVIVSFVRTPLKPRLNAGRWLQDARRLNVAFTRARRSLILIGNLTTLIRLRGDPEGEKILAHLGECVAAHPEHRIEQLKSL